MLVPIPKKGNLSCCDNWRGISLLDVAGKVTARILQIGYRNWLRKNCLSPNVAFAKAADAQI